MGLVTGEVKPSLRATLESYIVGRDRLQIVVGQSHPWYKRAEISLDELTSTVWVMRESGSGTQQMFEQAIRRWGIDPTDLNTVLTLGNFRRRVYRV